MKEGFAVCGTVFAVLLVLKLMFSMNAPWIVVNIPCAMTILFGVLWVCTAPFGKGGEDEHS